MESHVMQVSNSSNGIQQQPLIWPIEADIICLFSTVEGYTSRRDVVQGSILVLNLCHQIRNWLNNYRKDKTELEFHHLLIRVNNAIGMIQMYFPIICCILYTMIRILSNRFIFYSVKSNLFEPAKQQSDATRNGLKSQNFTQNLQKNSISLIIPTAISIEQKQKNIQLFSPTIKLFLTYPSTDSSNLLSLLKLQSLKCF